MMIPGWSTMLYNRVDALGDNPSDEQLDKLSNWIIENVPYVVWDRIAWQLPGKLSTEFRMRAAEMGY